MSAGSLPWMYHFEHVAAGQASSYLLGDGGFDALDDIALVTVDSIRRMRLTRDAFGGGSWEMGFPSADKLVAGALIQHNSGTDADGIVLGFRNGANNELNLEIQNGSLRIRLNATVLETIQTLSVNTDYYIELVSHTHASAGSYEVYVDGLLVASDSGIDTLNVGNPDKIYGNRGGGSTGAGFFYAYMYVKEWDDAVTPGQYGPLVFHHVAPDGDQGTPQWTATPGAGANYEEVDEASIDDDTTYIETSTDNLVDEYTSANAPGGLTTILATLRYAVGKAPAGGAPKFDLGWGDGTNTAYDADLTPASTYRTQMSAPFFTHPDTNPWTETNFNAVRMLTRSTLV